MGVPAFFRWLSRKYSSIVVHCHEEKPRVVDGVAIPVDTALPNPNNVEFDNLYLDMNGIIHPCCHPENKPAPKNEDEMMVAIFEYIDRLFSIVRPRRLLYMAIDGVAPRAKMNQQRSRRFRASKESKETREDISKIKEDLMRRGLNVPPDKPAGEHFDSNCITPGTEFMFRLADCLRYYIHVRLNTDPGWANIAVILSDANVPGEGEHKIMDYIRRQRAQPDHDPNTHHCMCGADADLIMLGLATHEAYFTIIREEFKPNKAPSCSVCGQTGHNMKECMGLPKEMEGEFDELTKPIEAEQEFIFLRLNVLREYLTHELTMTNLPFKQDIERAIDDWVLMCFFVGNDFLPHLPSLEIREGAIDKLITLYKKAVYKTGGYLTDSGTVNLSRVQLILTDLGEMEDQIFKNRRETEMNFKRREDDKKRRQKQMAEGDRPRWMTNGQYEPAPVRGRGGVQPIVNPRQTAFEMRQQAMGMSTSNHDAAASLKASLAGSSSSGDCGGGKKRKIDEVDDDDEPEDEVKLWEDGWKDRYYENKFGVGAEDVEFRHNVANEYVIGICWVLKYYYQGCASWDWYFPYHYAPFASDFVNIGDLDSSFKPGTKPFKPLEQLMSVFPAASKKFLPPSWQQLMDSPDSPIIDFYPVDFRVDLNGKKYAWQGVALLPFVDEVRLQETLQTVYPDLTEYEMRRNVRGNDRLFVSSRYPCHDFLEALYEQGISDVRCELNPSLTLGIRGTVWCDPLYIRTGMTVKSPIDQLDDYPDNRAISIMYEDPQYDGSFVFPARLLSGAKMPDRVLKPEDLNRRGGSDRNWKPQTGFSRDNGYSARMNASTAIRHVGSALNGAGGAGRGMYSHMPPPPRGQNSYGGGGGMQQPQRGGYGGYSGGAGRGGYGSSGYGGGANQSNSNSGGYGGGSYQSRSDGQGAVNLGWQRNVANQQGAYQQNQQRSGYSQPPRPFGGSGYGNFSGYGQVNAHNPYSEQEMESYRTSSRPGPAYGGGPSRYPYPPRR